MELTVGKSVIGPDAGALIRSTRRTCVRASETREESIAKAGVTAEVGVFATKVLSRLVLDMKTNATLVDTGMSKKKKIYIYIYYIYDSIATILPI